MWKCPTVPALGGRLATARASLGRRGPAGHVRNVHALMEAGSDGAGGFDGVERIGLAAATSPKDSSQASNAL